MGVKISGAELEIMEYLWKRDEKCTFAELLDYFNENRQKDWCKQTLNTNILRLKKRGLLTKEKNSGKAVYYPTITEVRYEQMCAEEILEESYGGRISNFIMAFTGNSKITEKEKEELLDYIDQLKG